MSALAAWYSASVVRRLHGLAVEDFIDAVEAAEREALALHDTGRCSESEWSCSRCEALAE